MGLGVDVLVWVGVLAALIALASVAVHRSYHHFLERARGPTSAALRRGAVATALDALLAPLEQAHPGQSGLCNLLDNPGAFAARSTSAALAGRSLDLMYYIWRTDLSGWLLIDDLVAAADRGVRVRLLLDDVNVQGYDPTFLALTQHPRIEVRLFNPIRSRGHWLRRVAEMLLGLSRFNRRMHGKLWIADGRLAILGGRNIGDTYFGALESHDRDSVDADVMLVGDKVAEVSAVFDGYWNLGLSLPIMALWPSFHMGMGRFRRRLARHAAEPPALRFRAAALDGHGPARLTAGLRWTDRVRLLADPPDKAYGLRSAPWMSEAIASVLTEARHEVRMTTPYFVPGHGAMEGLARLCARGVRVGLLTNALASTDMVVVHGAYRHYRARMLAAGAEVHEFSPPAKPGRRRDVLHSKVFLIDGQQALVGSLNFDLRSATTNTELGLLFEQPELVAELAAMYDRLCAPDHAQLVTQGGAGLRWVVARPGLPGLMAVEPEAPWTRRAASWIVGHLPIQAYL
ncbi:phospholipase D family protein [Paracoccaceae bacterium Fryx2]|nr:phospholipase D family protein [Paracoccaceae bacterium Fryx2]